jgi:hypothetical protein
MFFLKEKNAKKLCKYKNNVMREVILFNSLLVLILTYKNSYLFREIVKKGAKIALSYLIFNVLGI